MGARPPLPTDPRPPTQDVDIRQYLGAPRANAAYLITGVGQVSDPESPPEVIFGPIFRLPKNTDFGNVDGPWAARVEKFKLNFYARLIQKVIN